MGQWLDSKRGNFSLKFKVACVMYIHVGKKEWQICFYEYSYGTLKSPPFQSYTTG